MERSPQQTRRAEKNRCTTSTLLSRRWSLFLSCSVIVWIQWSATAYSMPNTHTDLSHQKTRSPLQASLRPPSLSFRGQASLLGSLSQAQTTTPSFAWGNGYGTFFFVADIVWTSAIIGGVVSLVGNIYTAVTQKQLLGWGISGTALSALSLLGCLFAFSLPRSIHSLAFLGLGAIALIAVLAPLSFSNLLRDEVLSQNKSVAYIKPTLTPWVDVSPQQGVTAGIALSSPF